MYREFGCGGGNITWKVHDVLRERLQRPRKIEKYCKLEWSML
jgi:hypothetical protein